MEPEFEHHYNKYILKSLPSIHSKEKYDNGFIFLYVFAQYKHSCLYQAHAVWVSMEHITQIQFSSPVHCLHHLTFFDFYLLSIKQSFPFLPNSFLHPTDSSTLFTGLSLKFCFTLVQLGSK